MNAFHWQWLICLSAVGFLLYRDIDSLNALTQLRLSIPLLQEELREIQERNVALQYAIIQSEHPLHLIEQWERPPFRHLRYPLANEVISFPDTPASAD